MFAVSDFYCKDNYTSGETVALGSLIQKYQSQYHNCFYTNKQYLN